METQILFEPRLYTVRELGTVDLPSGEHTRVGVFMFEGEEDQMLLRNTFGSEMYLWYKSRDVVPTRATSNLQGPILWIHRSILGTGQPITTELKDETTQG